MKNRDFIIWFICTEIIYLTSWLINVRIGNLGYLSASDFFIMTFAGFFRPEYGFLMAAIGCLSADFSLDVTQFLLVTFIIKGLEGGVVSHLERKGVKFVFIALWSIIIVLFGYAAAASVTYGWTAGLTALKYYGIQCVLSALAAIIIHPLTKKLKERYGTEVH